MRVISRRPLREFWTTHPNAEAPLRRWLNLAERKSWASIRHVRQTYPHADAVADASGQTLTVFNVGGNNYRVVTRIIYRSYTLYVLHVLTHREYDRGVWKE